MNISVTSALVEFALAIRPNYPLLVVTNGKERQKVTELIAQLAMRSPIYIVAGSDWLPGHQLARIIRRETVHIREILEHIYLARAFTCYQLEDLLAETKPDNKPLLVLDFLHTFYNPDIPLPVRFLVLKQCCQYLTHLSKYKPVAIVVQQLPTTDYQYFYPFLAVISDKVLLPEASPEVASQLSLL